MSNMKEAFRGLATMSQLSMQLLIPVLIGTFGGIWLDSRFGGSPWCTVIGVIIGIAAAFRNLYVWSIRQIHKSRQSERAQRAVRELGMHREQTQKEELRGGNE